MSATQDEEADEEGGACTLCVLAHGMGGDKDDWRTWLEYLRDRCPSWNLRPLESLARPSMPLVGKGLAVLAAHAAAETLEALRELAARPSPGPGSGRGEGPLTLHCVGHSMGGLVLRAALPAILAGAPLVELGVFLTLSTPHLGVQASWGAPEAMWRNLSCLTGIFSPQLPQLAIQDRAQRQPYLVVLADPEGPHVAALRRFRRRICATMAHADPVIPVASGVIWPRRAWTKPDAPASQAAGWGFEAFSADAAPDRLEGESGTCSASSPSASLRADRPFREEPAAMAWARSADGACCFPKQVLEGLETLQWERVVVRLQMPSSSVHVFLIGKASIGKASAQGALEHHFARECVYQLVENLTAAARNCAPRLGEPRWLQAVNIQASSREQCSGRWTVATEEGVGVVKFYAFDAELEANFCFESFGATSRVLFDPDRVEQRRAGANVASYHTICEHVALPPRDVAPAGTAGRWTVATEEGLGRVRFYSFDAAAAATKLFTNFGTFGATSRVLFDPCGVEVQKAGWNRIAHSTILHTFRREQRAAAV